jgi:hypothetical protein
MKFVSTPERAPETRFTPLDPILLNIYGFAKKTNRESLCTKKFSL